MRTGRTLIPLMLIVLTVLILSCLTMTALHCTIFDVHPFTNHDNVFFVALKCDQSKDWSDQSKRGQP